MKRLPREFFARDTHDVARDILGKLLVRRWRNKNFIVRITDVEAYIGEDDRASHARFGKTNRTAVMYGPAGYSYVYLIYGMYNCLNIVTEDKDSPAALLVRGATSVDGSPHKNSALNGPGKLCRTLNITRTHNATDLTTSDKLWLADDRHTTSPTDISTGPRINIDYAGTHAELPWRYYLGTSE